MSVNAFAFSQAATLLNSIVQQATGQTTITNIATPQDFIRVAQTALLTGNDPVLNAVSQMWSRTIFRVTEARNPLETLQMTEEQYGNATRKLSPVAMDSQDDDRHLWPVQYDAVGHPANPLGNGVAADDMFKLNKQEVLQTNFYGTAVYERMYTIFKDQFECAFTSPEELLRFNAMLLTERNNDKVRFATNAARGLQANFIAGLIDEGNTSRVIHCLTEYNTLTGLTLDAQTVFQPGNFEGFIRWLYARINTIVQLMGESTQEFQTVINSKAVIRQSKPENLRVAMLSTFMNEIDSMVAANTYHNDKLKMLTYESIPFWQSIEYPDSVDVTPVYTSTAGAVTQAVAATEQAGIIGLIHDKNALGYSFVGSWGAVSPLQIRGGYYNECQHANLRTISDNTEKAVVLLLD